MIRIVLFVLASGVAACSTVAPEVTHHEPVKLGVVQAGTQQNAELVFCKSENCPQRTPKHLHQPIRVSQPVSVVKPEPKQVHFKVHFRWGWSRLDEAGHKEAAALVASGLLKDAKHIEVAGRTDPTGQRKFNEKLAARRADTVKALLVMAGISDELITTAVQTPCCDGTIETKAAMRQLRRTDIEITVTK